MKYNIEYGITNLISESKAREYKVIPIAMKEKKLSAAVSEDTAVDNFLLLREYFKEIGICELELLTYSEIEIVRLINTYYSIEFENKKILDNLNLFRNSQNAKALFDYIILEALKLKASDIHIINENQYLVVRFRIKGKIKTFCMLDRSLGEKLIRVLKVKSNIEISKTKSPKDSRLRYLFGENEADIRVSIINTIQGEKISLRILNSQDIPSSINQLNLNHDEIKIIKRAIALSSGFILICGPTGSGKSTTLRCFLNEINDADRHIISVEDPIEYKMEGITQIQVEESSDNAFNKALRYIVRQDPDIIYIGEIRDYESADIATKASLTGHLVLSTLHARDSILAINRMENLGIDRDTIISSLNLIVNQRLVSILCDKCKRKIEYKGKSIEELHLYEGNVIYEASGCIDCGYSGYEKIIPVMDILVLDDNMKLNIKTNNFNHLITDNILKKILDLFKLGKIELKEALKYFWY